MVKKLRFLPILLVLLVMVCAASSSGGKTYAAAGSATGSNIAKYACQFVGNPYVPAFALKFFSMVLNSELRSSLSFSPLMISSYLAFISARFLLKSLPDSARA